MSKILEIVTEPEKKFAGSTFKLKIKVDKSIRYNELKTKTCSELKKYKYAQFVKGE